MKQKISCPCASTFTVEFDEKIDLDKNPELLEQIFDGSFLNFYCANCGKKHKPEFPLVVQWPEKKITIEVVPELNRGEFFMRKKYTPNCETIIGYPELADRLAVLRDGLEPVVIEAIKYYLLVRAEESYPELKISAWYQNLVSDDEGNNESIEFHLHGIKADEIAVSRIPWSFYSKNCGEYRRKPKSELFSSLRHKNYLSVANMLKPEWLQ